MAREEIVKRIDEIETQRFYLSMVDRWTARDCALDDTLASELYDLKRKLMEM